MPLTHRALLTALLLLLFNSSSDAAASNSRMAGQGKHGKTKPVAAAPAISAVCNDFYTTANADWLKAHPASASTSAFSELRANARAQEIALLQDFARAPQDDTQRSLAMLWADGMNEPAIEAAGATPLQPLFDRIAKAKKARDLPGVIADLHAAGVPVLFNFSANADPRDPGHQIGYAVQGGLGLPDPDYYTRTDAETRDVLGRYRAYVETILRLSGTPADKVSTESGWVLGIEMQLAQASQSLAQSRAPDSLYRPLALRDLTKAYPHLALDKFLRAQNANSDTISLAPDGFFRMADGLLANVPVEQWQAYLRFHVATAMAPYLARAFADAHQELYGHLLEGDAQPPTREQFVLDTLDRALGAAMGHAYAQRYLPTAARAASIRIADGLREAMRRAIAGNAWMDDATRAIALAKLDKLRIEIGEPSSNASLVGLTLGNGFASDMLAIAAWQHQRDMGALDRNGDGQRSTAPDWPVPAQVPYIGYDLVQNRLVITAAFLQAPIFDAFGPLERQFGALGSAVGHQLHYVVDGKGRGVDADGRFRDWWSPATSAAHEQRIAPIAAQYDAYPVLGAVKVNGGATRDENLADLAGVELALDAMKHIPEYAAAMAANSAAPPSAKPAARISKPARHGSSKTAAKTPIVAPPPMLAGFFDAYANVWASSAFDAAAAETAIAVQAPAKYRVNGVLANLPEFGKAYSCKPGQPMMNAAPVSVWR